MSTPQVKKAEMLIMLILLALLALTITAFVVRTKAKLALAKDPHDYDPIIRWGATHQTVDDVINGAPTKVTKVIPLTGAECQNRLNEQVLTNKYIDALKEIAAKQGNVIITDGKTVPMVTVPQPAK